MSFLLSNINIKDWETLDNQLKHSKFESIKKTFPIVTNLSKKDDELANSSRKRKFGSIDPSRYSMKENLNELLFKGAYGDVLTNDSESVMEFSLLSVPPTKPQRDCDIQLFTPCVIGNGESLSLKEINAHLVLLFSEYRERRKDGPLFLSNVGGCLIPQTVKIMQLLRRFRQETVCKTDATKFLQLSIDMFQDIWLPNLASSIAAIGSAMDFLQEYEGQYSKIETVKSRAKAEHEEDIEKIINAWSKLNYFPKILLRSLVFDIQSHVLTQAQCGAIAKYEFTKKIIVTMILEMSKTFTKITEIIFTLDIQELFPNSTMEVLIEAFLDCTIECRNGEIMIGIAELLEKWISCQPKYAKGYHIWCEGMLVKYNVQRASDNKSAGTSPRENSTDDVTDEQDLMFNRWEIGILFLRDILEYTELEPRTTNTDPDSTGWLTVFQDDLADQEQDTAGTNDGPNEAELATIASIDPPQTRVQDHQSKRAALREWAHRSRKKISHKYHSIVGEIENRRHAKRQKILITSVRCYNVTSRPNAVTPDSLYHLQRVTQKLYKKEQRGKRKRDAIKVIFSIS